MHLEAGLAAVFIEDPNGMCDGPQSVVPNPARDGLCNTMRLISPVVGFEHPFPGTKRLVTVSLKGRLELLIYPVIDRLSEAGSPSLFTHSIRV